MAALINGELGGKFAQSRDSGTVDIIVPFNYEGNTVELMAILENIKVNIDQKSKVVLNERTGTVVMGGQITLSPVAISHGDLTVEIRDESSPVKPGATAKTTTGRVLDFKGAASVSDLVKALNALGVQPKDLTAIFQTLREMGALQAELEIM